GTGRMPDLGCGTGQLATRFTDWLEEIVGIDTEQEMLVEANRLSNENRVGNVRWLQGKAEDRASDAGTFRLVTIAKSFHWMDIELTMILTHRSRCFGSKS
ncbi:MAG: methyltransferase, partial [Bacilli bacterium]|nr:methyltransferase [Bacilli bacterium]